MTETATEAGARPSKGPYICALLARWALGGLFIWMGWNKASDPVDFLKLLRQYNMVESSLALNAIAIALPWFEIFCGILLLAGIAVRGAALILTLMLIVFTCVVIHRAQGIHALQHIPFCAIKFDCGCGNGEVLICRKIAENAGLLLLSIWILLAGGGRAQG